MPTILIADDDRVFVELLSARLQADGFQVVVAFDTVQALMSAMRGRPDALVLDVRMPGGDGLEALRKLKRSARTATIPVIVASALDDPELPGKVSALGAFDFLQKPVSYDAVRAILARVLGEEREPELRRAWQARS